MNVVVLLDLYPTMSIWPILLLSQDLMFLKHMGKEMQR